MRKAVLVLFGVLLTGIPVFAAGSNQRGSGNSQTRPYEVVWYVPGDPPLDLDTVITEVNRYLAEKINCTLKMVFTDFGNYEQKMQMLIASQEPFDICYTAPWINNYYNNVNKNAYLELDDLLTQYAPDLMRVMPSNGWVAARTRGYIFGIPSITVFASPVGIAVETEYLDRYNMPYTGYKNLADIEPLLAAIKRDNPNMYPIAERLSAWGYDAQAGEHIPGVVMLEDQDLKVLNQFELPQVREHFQLLRSWYLKGYIQPDAVTSTSNAAETLAGLHPVGTTGAIYPMAESNLTNNHGGRRTIALVFNDPWMSTASITASMNAISRTSKDPVKAMQFLNLLNSDVYLYNLIARGVEGKHYRRTDAIHVSAIENSGYRPQTDWVFGNQFLAYYWEDQKGDEYERTIIQNNNGRPSPALGFSLDTSPIQTEMASVSAVVNEYLPALETGAVDTDTVLPEFIAKLRDAGSQRIIAEIQRQIDIWKAGSDTNK